MAKETESWTRRIGGNRTLVLAIMISMLILFTVDYYVVQALGVGNRGAGYLRFTVHGRVVEMDAGRYQTLMSDWQRYQGGQAMLTGRPRGGSEDFLMDLMIAELARDAGMSIPDATLREFIRVNPLFADGSGEFDAAKFDEALRNSYGGLRPKAFEEQARLSLLITHFVSVYDQAYRIVDDGEAWNRWKADYPKVGVVYAWAAASDLRAAMKAEDLKPEEVEAYWKNPGVQDRHRLRPRYRFEAAWLPVAATDDQAYLDARREWKDDPDLQVRRDRDADEGFDHFFVSRASDFAIADQPREVVDALRAENEAAVKAEDEEKAKSGSGAATPPAPPPMDPSGAEGPPVDPAKLPPEKLEDREVYRRYWRHRVEKEIWLRKLLAKVLKASDGGKVPLEKAAEPFARPGLRVRIHLQDDPVDQYGIEKIPGLGFPNCDLRYVMNEKRAEDEGKSHAEILPMSPNRQVLTERGWVAFRVLKVLPEEVPPLDTVRDAVASELLDERARDRARAGLEELRKASEDARRPLAEAAKEKGYPTETAAPFNAYSWRPPAPKPATGVGVPEVRPATAEGWRNPDRRLAAVMSRYSALRDTPVGAFGPVLDDGAGSGAFYLAQVTAREEPAFEEMTESQRNQFRRLLGRERLAGMSQELGYAGLKNRLGLLINGQPAPEPEAARRPRQGQ